MGLLLSGMQREIKGVFFDMDGVLVDVSGSYRRAIQETAAHFLGREIDAELIQQYKNRGGFNDDWALTHAIVQEASVDVPLEEIVRVFQEWYRGAEWDGLISREPALVETRTLRQIRASGRFTALVTGRPETEARWTLRRFGWEELFPVVVGMESQDGRGKPDPFPLLLALESAREKGFSMRPDEVVYVGDSIDDVIAARAAGMWAIGLVPPYLDVEKHSALLRERGAHMITTDSARLADLLDNFFERISEDSDRD